MTRDAIDTALFNLIAGSTYPAAPVGWATASRTLRLWKDVQPNEMPAFFLAFVEETATPLKLSPAIKKWSRHYFAWIYVSHDGGANPAMKALASALDRVEARFVPATGTKQTLGGLVYEARLEGTTKSDEGSLGDQAIARVPITVIVSP
jgi:hypothetical protein